MNDYTVLIGWNTVDVQLVVLNAESFRDACVEARRTYGKAWSYVGVMNPDDTSTLNVAWHHTHGTMTPEEWVTRRLAGPVEVAIVSIDQFLAALQPQLLGDSRPTSARPVWILLNGMLYAPAQIGLDPEFGAIVIVPSPAPSGTHVNGAPSE